MNVLQYLDAVYVQSRLGLSEKAADQIRYALQGLDCDIAQLSEALILEHLRSLKSRGLSPATINTRRAYLLGIWNHAFRKGYNAHDPRKADVPRMAEYKRQPQAWSLEDLRRMLAVAEQVKRRGSCWWAANEWTALILLLYYTGLRITAALSLPRTALRGTMLTVPPEIQKDREEMLFRLPVELCNRLLALPRPMLQKHGRNVGEYLLPWPWSLHDPQSKLTHHIIRPAGLPITRRLKFHALRKTVATLVAVHAGKESARNVMGHSAMSVTERYLADPQTVDPSLPGRLSPVDVLPKLA